MIDSFYRAPFQKWFIDPLAKSVHLHPHSITLLSLGFGILAAFLISFGSQWAAALSFVFSGYLDVLDGSIARLQKKSSPLGATLDLVSDRAVEFAVLFGLCSIDPSARAGTSLLMLGAMYLCIASFFSVSMFTKGESEKSFVYSPGLVERAETFILFTLMIFWQNAFVPLGIAYAACVFLTTGFRMWEFIKQNRGSCLE